MFTGVCPVGGAVVVRRLLAEEALVRETCGEERLPGGSSFATPNDPRYGRGESPGSRTRSVDGARACRDGYHGDCTPGTRIHTDLLRKRSPPAVFDIARPTSPRLSVNCDRLEVGVGGCLVLSEVQTLDFLFLTYAKTYRHLDQVEQRQTHAE